MHRIRLPRLAAVTASLTTSLAAIVFISAVPAAAAGVNYVALGDSYSSGVGAGSYISTSGSCLRSTKSYPYLWYTSHTTTSFSFVACSGAKTTDVINNQLGALNSATTLVSITIGGNDVGFAGIMVDCNLYGTTTCVNEINAAENVARTQLPGWLDNVYNQIRARAPSAKVVVLSYPRFYDISASWYCPGLSTTSRKKINEGADVLDTVTAGEVAKYSNFAFADVRAAFANGHEICDFSSWMHSVDWTNLTQSYHPNASGYSGGYLPALRTVTG